MLPYENEVKLVSNIETIAAIISAWLHLDYFADQTYIVGQTYRRTCTLLLKFGSEYTNWITCTSTCNLIIITWRPLNFRML